MQWTLQNLLNLANKFWTCSKIWSQKREKKLQLAKYACKFGRILITHLFLRRSLNIESADCKNLACFKGKSDRGAWKICKRVNLCWGAKIWRLHAFWSTLLSIWSFTSFKKYSLKAPYKCKPHTMLICLQWSTYTSKCLEPDGPN